MKTLALKKSPMKNTFAALIASLVILFTPSAKAEELGPYSVKMWNYLDQLTQLGPRNPGSRGHRLTQDLIKKSRHPIRQCGGRAGFHPHPPRVGPAPNEKYHSEI